MDEFDRRVSHIGRRKALAFFAKRIGLLLVFLYFAIAAYGHFHKPAPEPVCSCDACDCGTLDDLRSYEKGESP